MAPKATSCADSITSTVQTAKKKFRLKTFLKLFVVKWSCTLLVLNFYWISSLDVVRLENTLAKMMHLSGSRGQSKYATVPTKEEWLASNATKSVRSRSKTLPEQSPKNATKEGTMIVPNLADGTLQGKERLWTILQTRNVTQVDAAYWASIPSWDAILQNLHYDKRGGADAGPIIHGLETCKAFQNATSANPSQRRIAPAGLFNTGTNYLSVLLEYNCQNPHRVEKFHGNAKRGHGNEWEVPWGKHSPASSRGVYYKNAKIKYTVEEVLPVVLIRNPFGWMKAMCRNPYTAKWRGVNDKKSCPRLKEGEKWNAADVKYGAKTTHHQSLGHLWSDWYGEYFYSNNTRGSTTKKPEAPFPRLMIRFEDIIFFPYEVTKQVCECAGGVLGHRQDDKDVAENSFHYVVRSAKAGIGHGPASQRNGLIDSWLRYGSSDPTDDFSKEEVDIAKEALDPSIMNTFGYR
ncbi:hypothetical protein ACHAXT_006800 [Thalassiosira profunda]